MLAPDFGWGTAGLRADWVKKGVVVPIDDVMKQAGLDLSDFNDLPLQRARYGGKLAMVPMDIYVSDTYVTTRVNQVASIAAPTPTSSVGSEAL